MNNSRSTEYDRNSFDAATKAYGAARYTEAARLCASVLDQDQDHAAAHNLMGTIAATQGAYDQAIKHFKNAVEKDPGNSEHLENLCEVSIASNRAPDACAILNKAIPRDPTNVKLLILRGGARMARQDFAGAASDYRAAVLLDPRHPDAQQGLVAALNRSRLDSEDSQSADDLRRCLQFNHIEPGLLGPVFARFLANRHGITGQHAQSNLEEIVTDDLFIQALACFNFTDAAMERFLTGLRERLLRSSMEAGRVPADWQRFMVNLALHNERAEFAQYQTGAEDERLEQLESAVSRSIEGEKSAKEIAGAMLLLALYRSLKHYFSESHLRTLSIDDWPQFFRPLAELYIEQLNRADTPVDIAVLGERRSPDASGVQAMYEEHPYPRWQRLGRIDAGSTAERLMAQIPGFTPPAWASEDEVDVLIAGCGTGRHALHVALECRNARVLAVDISSASLKYAHDKMQEHGVSNLKLMQADIFDLPEFGRKFHVIQTVGTLETLAEPERGWRVLRELLRGDGLMYVGSYSELARKPVVAARESIRQQGLEGTPADMRAFRKQVLDGQLGESGRLLTYTGDFYSMSGCRDLLFHVSEKRFTLRQLRSIWDDNGLTLLSFYPLLGHLLAAYRKRYPDDPHATDVNNWIAFEEEDSKRFGALMGLSMFSYWLKATD